MKHSIILILLVSLCGCAELKFRWKNYNGDRSQAEMDKDWKDCYQYSSNQPQMQNCIEKKGYYSESYVD